MMESRENEGYIKTAENPCCIAVVVKQDQQDKSRRAQLYAAGRRWICGTLLLLLRAAETHTQQTPTQCALQFTSATFRIAAKIVIKPKIESLL